MKQQILKIELARILILLTGFGYAQQAYDARAAGMAFSNGATTIGLQQVGLNPATLAIKTDFRFEFNLISVNATANNNSFRKSQYDNYLTTGRTLTDEEVRDILSSVPAGGLRVDGLARVNTLAFYVPNFSLSLVGLGVAVANLPREFIELPLGGNNEPGRVYYFDGARANDWTGLGVIVSGGLPVWSNRDAALDFFSIGATFKYISGVHYDNVIRAQGILQDFSLANDNPYVQLEGEMEYLTSNGGRGVGADLGVLATFNKNFSIGLTLLNAVSDVKWNSGTEKTILSIRGDSLSLPGRIRDSLIVHRDTTFAVNSFSTNLSRVLDLALAYQFTPDFLVTAQWEQGLDNSMGGTTRSRAAVGLEYTGIPVLPLRAGLTVGAKTGTSLAFGAGINLKNWYLDLAYLNHGSFVVGDFKGIGVALSTRLRF
jgi:hypothetical protein